MARPPCSSDSHAVATFRRGHSCRKQMRRDLGDGPVETTAETPEKRRGSRPWWEIAEPQDLRGLPMVGPGIGGAIRGTSPGRNL